MKRRLLYTILSISLLTVMAGAAIAPALGVISAHFAGRNPLLIQLIVSLPALFIILTNLVFPWLCRLMKTRTLALTGLALYVLSGAGAFFVDNIWMLLVFRALMGVSVGMIMPLSTGLLAYYFPPEEQAGLMGLSAAMNQMGGVVATFLAGVLAGISWNYAFLVYLLGLIAIALVVLFLPNERLQGRGGISLSLLKRFHPSVVGMLLVMVLFFIYPTNFALTASGTLSEMGVTLTMVGLDVVAFLVGLCLSNSCLTFRFSSQCLLFCGFSGSCISDALHFTFLHNIQLLLCLFIKLHILNIKLENLNSISGEGRLLRHNSVAVLVQLELRNSVFLNFRTLNHLTIFIEFIFTSLFL